MRLKLSLEQCYTPKEAAAAWGISPATIRSRILRQPDLVQKMIEKGWMKQFKGEENERAEWILTTYAMYEFFGTPQ